MVSCQPLPGLGLVGQEAFAQHIAPDESQSGIGSQWPGFPAFCSGLKEGGDAVHRPAVQEHRPGIGLPRRADDHLTGADRGIAFPGHVRPGRTDGMARAFQGQQAYLASIALGQGIGGDKAKVPALSGQLGRTAEKVGHQVCDTACTPGQHFHQIFAVKIAQGLTHTVVTQKGRVAHQRVKARIVTVKDFGKFQRPVQGPGETGVVVLVLLGQLPAAAVHKARAFPG